LYDTSGSGEEEIAVQPEPSEHNTQAISEQQITHLNTKSSCTAMPGFGIIY
jgi:hypothetical protein